MKTFLFLFYFFIFVVEIIYKVVETHRSVALEFVSVICSEPQALGERLVV